jgi:Mg/Co/Ni transporter MgtE
MNVADALDRIRREGIGERVIYFFATDAEGRLAGVLPTRRLLTAPLEARLEEIMVRKVVAIPASATVLEACEFFVLYKFFAFPVVDSARRVIGVVDVSLFAEEMMEAGEREEERTAKLGDEFSKRLGSVSRKSAAPRPGEFSATVFRGCWRPSGRGPLARCSRGFSKRPWPAVS